MARVVLVLVLLVLNPGVGLSPALAEDCAAAADKSMTEGEIQGIINKTIEGSGDTVNLFVMPESGFKGVRLDLHGSDGTHHAAWFPVEPQCFRQDNKWYQSQAWANTNTDGSTSLSLGFRIWRCAMECTIDSPAPSQYNLSVVAHGASKWLTGNVPWQCTSEYMVNLNSLNVTTCIEPPAPTTTTTNTVTVPLRNQTQWQTTTNTTSDQETAGDNLWVVGVVVGLLVLVKVLVGVLVYLRNRRRWVAINYQTT